MRDGKVCRRVLGLLTPVVLAGLGCGGGSGGGGDVQPPMPGPIAASFFDSGTPAGPDRVRLRGVVGGAEVVVDVVIGGATASQDIYAFAFDLKLGDPTVATYVPGSATFGDALTLDPGQDGEVLVGQSDGRITVGVSKTGGGMGNGVGDGEKVVASLRFRVLKRDVTSLRIGGLPPAPAAIDSEGEVIPGVTFDTVTAAIRGS